MNLSRGPECRPTAEQFFRSMQPRPSASFGAWAVRNRGTIFLADLVDHHRLAACPSTTKCIQCEGVRVSCGRRWAACLCGRCPATRGYAEASDNRRDAVVVGTGAVGFSIDASVALEMVTSGGFDGPVVLLGISLSAKHEPAFFHAIVRLGSVLAASPYRHGEGSGLDGQAHPGVRRPPQRVARGPP